jgi:hypothetical protein
VFACHGAAHCWSSIDVSSKKVLAAALPLNAVQHAEEPRLKLQRVEVAVVVLASRMHESTCAVLLSHFMIARDGIYVVIHTTFRAAAAALMYLLIHQLGYRTSKRY